MRLNDQARLLDSIVINDLSFHGLTKFEGLTNVISFKGPRERERKEKVQTNKLFNENLPKKTIFFGGFYFGLK